MTLIYAITPIKGLSGRVINPNDFKTPYVRGDVEVYTNDDKIRGAYEAVKNGCKVTIRPLPTDKGDNTPKNKQNKKDK